MKNDYISEIHKKDKLVLHPYEDTKSRGTYDRKLIVKSNNIYLYDENDKVVGTAFPEEYHTLIAKRKENFTIKKMHYAGCPRWNYT